ncbi:hypothetical protein MMC07_001063 [Pseudocyphellaria aurata]|nr:hypothetical protein [Pseudocyphellaria aurata]
MVGTITHPEPFLLVLKGILVMFIQETDVNKIVEVYKARGVVLNPFFVTVVGDFSSLISFLPTLTLSEIAMKRMEQFEFMVRLDSVGFGASQIWEFIHESNYKEDINFVTDFLALGQSFKEGSLTEGSLTEGGPTNESLKDEA